MKFESVTKTLHIKCGVTKLNGFGQGPNYFALVPHDLAFINKKFTLKGGDECKVDYLCSEAIFTKRTTKE